MFNFCLRNVIGWRVQSCFALLQFFPHWIDSSHSVIAGITWSCRFLTWITTKHEVAQYQTDNPWNAADCKSVMFTIFTKSANFKSNYSSFERECGVSRDQNLLLLCPAYRENTHVCSQHVQCIVKGYNACLDMPMRTYWDRHRWLMRTFHDL